MVNSDENKEKIELDSFYHNPNPTPFWRRFAFGSWIVVLVFILFVIGGALVYKTSFTFSQMQTEETDNLGFTENMVTPAPDGDRFNILLLGLRGEEDPNGGLLTDSLMVLSIKKSTKQAALISIPRDLYVTIPGTDDKEKINFAYAFGFEQKGVAGALLFSKIAVAQATGLYMNRVVAVDHLALKDIVDTLGGINISLDKEFIEYQQWIAGGDVGSSSAFFIRTDQAATSTDAAERQRWVFRVPAGVSLLDGATTLYFVRARYSSSDFDRARRQQLILSAIRDKALSLGVLANPVKIFKILDSLGRNVRTDINVADIKDLIATAGGIESKNIIHKVFDTTPEGLLYAGRADNGAYILLPQGDDFSKIQEVCKKIFE